MAGFVKLFQSILDSTIWKATPATKVVWVTMMAMADRDGFVSASVPGLADRAKVSLKLTEKALALFLAPDPYSKTPDNEGRRIEVVPGGWRLLTYEKHREMMSAEDQREKNAKRQQRWRNRHRNAVTDGVTLDNACHDISEAESGSGSPHPGPSGSGSDQTRASKDDADAIDLTPVPPDQRRWSAEEWFSGFKIAWLTYAGTDSYGGQPGDWRFVGELREILADLSLKDALAAQARSGAIFAEYLTDQSEKLVSARHPWPWFVTRFNGLRLERGRSRTKTDETLEALADWEPPKARTA